MGRPESAGAGCTSSIPADGLRAIVITVQALVSTEQISSHLCSLKRNMTTS